MKKKMLNKMVYDLTSRKPFTYKDIIKLNLEDDDEVHIGYEDEEDSGDSLTPMHYYLHIYRRVIETDEEFEERVRSYENYQKIAKKMRYNTYLELKKEFEENNED